MMAGHLIRSVVGPVLAFTFGMAASAEPPPSKVTSPTTHMDFVLIPAGKFKMGFSPEYGFIGIAVALLGRNQPAGVVAAALLFGALHKGTADLDMETEHVTREVSLILQALIILSVSAEGLWSWMKRRGEL